MHTSRKREKSQSTRARTCTELKAVKLTLSHCSVEFLAQKDKAEHPLHPVRSSFTREDSPSIPSTPLEVKLLHQQSEMAEMEGQDCRTRRKVESVMRR